MRASLMTAAVAVGLLCPHEASAATLGSVQGDVLVNHGDGFRKLTQQGAGAILAPGTRVMVPPGGSAIIAYASNCAVRVPSGVWSVLDTPPCKDGATLIDFGTRMNQAAPPPEVNITPLVVGGLVVAGGVVAAIVLTQSDDKPASE